MLEQARLLKEYGWHLIRLERPGKRPNMPGGWSEYEDRQPTDEELVDWFGDNNSNIGVLVGASGLVVIDADDEAAVRVCEKHLPKTPIVVKTAKGKHFYYKKPKGKVGNKIRAKLKDVEGDYALDVKGDGGYVVFAQSVHESGVVYELEGDLLPFLDLVEYDDSWLKVKAPPSPAPTYIPFVGAVDRIKRASAYISKMAPAIAGQQGHSDLLRVARVAYTGFDLDDNSMRMVLADYSSRCSPPWSEKELEHKISQVKAHPDPGGRPRGHLLACEQRFEVRGPIIPSVEEVQQKSLEVPLKTIRDLPKEVAGAYLGLGAHSGAPVGVEPISRYLSTWPRGQLIVLAGKPGHGKTAVMRSIAYDVAKNGRSLVVSLEESWSSFAMGIAASKTGVLRMPLQDGGASDIDVARVRDYVWFDKTLRNISFVADRPSDPSELYELAVLAHKEQPYDMIAIDYLQYIADKGGPSSDVTQSIARACHIFKKLAVDLNVCVVTGSQFRKGATGSSERPNTNDLYGSMRIEADADVIMLLHSEYKAKTGGSRKEWMEGLLEVEVAKNRQGVLVGTAVVGIDQAMIYNPLKEKVDRYLREIEL